VRATQGIQRCVAPRLTIQHCEAPRPTIQRYAAQTLRRSVPSSEVHPLNIRRCEARLQDSQPRARSPDASTPHKA
jgi:hypothetical protein